MQDVAAASKNSKVLDQEMVVLRHKEVASAIGKYSQGEITRFISDSARLRSQAARSFWAGEGSKNRAILRKCGMGQEDVAQMCQIWAVGYLAYAKQAGGEVPVDGRLDHYLRQRFVEMITRLGRRAKSCAPSSQGVAGRSADILEASASSHMTNEEQVTEAAEMIRRIRKGPRAVRRLLAREASAPTRAAYPMPKAKSATLEKLAAMSHRDAIERMSVVLADEIDDGRSQAARIVKAMADCRGGSCLVCSARSRRPSDALIDVPSSVSLPEVRLFVEAHLDLVTAAIPRRKVPSIVRAGIALGLLVRSSDGTISATSWGFALVSHPRGSLAEKMILGSLVVGCRSIFARHQTASPSRPQQKISMTEEERKQAGALLRSLASLSALAEHYSIDPNMGGPPGWLSYCRTAPLPPENLCVVKDFFVTEFRGEEKMSAQRIVVPAVRCEQNDRTFYMATVPVDDLFPCCFVDRHGDNEKGYQRKLEEPRAAKIAAYLAQPGNSIPGNVVLSATADANISFDELTGELSFDKRKGAFAALDGQHRLWGYHKCERRLQVPSTIYVELDAATECRLFIDVNEEQKGVPRALLLQIKSLAGIESAREAELRALFDQFQKDERSPLRELLHASSRKQGKISRASFDYALGPAQRSQSFAAIQETKRFAVLLEYVRAFHAALNDKTMMERRYYFAAMFGVFDEVLRSTKTRTGNIAKANLAKTIKDIANVTGPTQTAIATAMRSKLSGAEIADSDSAEYEE